MKPIQFNNIAFNECEYFCRKEREKLTFKVLKENGKLTADLLSSYRFQWTFLRYKCFRVFRISFCFNIQRRHFSPSSRKVTHLHLFYSKNVYFLNIHFHKPKICHFPLKLCFTKLKYTEFLRFRTLQVYISCESQNDASCSWEGRWTATLIWEMVAAIHLWCLSAT